MKTKLTPLIMSAPMILSLNAGRKTVTRRTSGLDEFGPEARVVCMNRVDGRFGVEIAPRPGQITFVPCRYGAPGDELWFRESIRRSPPHEQGRVAEYIADGAAAPIEKWIWKNSALPAIHMPEKFCRHRGTLVQGVRVERLLDITEEDAIAEGLEPRSNFLAAIMKRGGPDGKPDLWRWPGGEVDFPTAREAYLAGWDSLHGEGHHKLNQLVWRLPFNPRRVQ